MSAKQEQKPPWLKYKLEDVEKIVVNLARQGFTAEKIGLVLRDQYGIPTVRVYGTRLADILKKHNLYKPPELINLKRKVERIRKHMAKNKHDMRSKRALTITEAKLRKTMQYLEKRGENVQVG